MRPETSPARRVGTYLVLTFALSAWFYFLIIRAGKLEGAGGLWVAGLMWCPAAAALLASALTGRPLREIGWRWSWRYTALAYALPLLYGALAYAATWGLGLGGFPNLEFLHSLEARFGAPPAGALSKFLLFQGTVGVLLSCVTGLGEEIGWRGFLVPELSRRMPLSGVALVSGAIWAAWHYPILLFADYNGGTHPWYSLACFTVLVLGISFVFAWLRLRSGSVWPAAILHGSHNLFIQEVFDPLTADTGPTAWIIGEFGAALALVGIVLGSLAWRRRGALALPAREAA